MAQVWARILMLLAAAALFPACSPSPQSGAGFSLPQGDADAGRQLFVEFGCNGCHAVAGVEPTEMAGPVTIELGGEVSRVKTYGELVTSVINPSHRTPTGYSRSKVMRDGKSRMTVYNEVMTVQELIDLVAFLESTYQVAPLGRRYEEYSYERWQAEREGVRPPR